MKAAIFGGPRNLVVGERPDPVIRQPSLLVGVMTAPGNATPNVAIAIGSQAQADARFGEGSELSRMFKAFFANNFANEVWGLPMAEGSAAAPPLAAP